MTRVSPAKHPTSADLHHSAPLPAAHLTISVLAPQVIAWRAQFETCPGQPRGSSNVASWFQFPIFLCLSNEGFNLGKSTVSVGHFEILPRLMTGGEKKTGFGPVTMELPMIILFDKLSLSRFLRNDLYTRYRSVPHMVFMLGTYLPTCPC